MAIAFFESVVISLFLIVTNLLVCTEIQGCERGHQHDIRAQQSSEQHTQPFSLTR